MMNNVAKAEEPMFQSAKNGLLAFFVSHEGRTRHPYIDILGYVTSGIGNLMNSPAAMMQEPWKNPDGSLASAADVTAAYNALVALRTAPVGQKQIGSIAMQGGNSAAMQAVTAIRLTNEDIDNLFYKTAASYENTVKQYFPGWEKLPADAQVLVMSMAWALGPAFPPGWPKFTAAINAHDFLTAGTQSLWGNINADRKASNLLLSANAAAVQTSGSDPSKLWYPNKDIQTAVKAGPGIVAIGVGIGAAAYAAWRIFSRS